MSNIKKLAFDIETVGVDFDALDKTTQESLTRWIEKESSSKEEYKIALEDLKDGLGFSPLTGEIAAIGIMDVEEEKGAVYFQVPGEKIKPFEEENFKFEAFDERGLLQKFWEVAEKYQYFITFNGRSFDIPFLMIRSAALGVRPSKDLMRGRYLYQQNPNAIQIDLLDQLTFYGAVRKKGNLHLWARLFGIESPKDRGVTGDDVGSLFKNKKFLDIARYNVWDVVATRELYKKWEDYLQF